MKHETTFGRGRSGFSLVEGLVVFAAIGILAAVAVSMGSGHHEAVAMRKLQSDVRAINTAIQVFQASGGSLDGVTSPVRVLALLKATADETSAEQTAAFTGRKVDPRLIVVMQTGAEAAAGDPRAVWNADRKKFEIAFSGPLGVRAFALSDKAAPAADAVVAYKPTMKLATEDEWIWDYTDNALGSGVHPTLVPVTPAGGGGPVAGPGPGPGGTPLPGPVGTPGRLDPPVFSIPKGKYPIGNFDLELYLLNPNSPMISRVFYSINGGEWLTYSGSAVLVPPDSTIAAKANTTDPAYYDSRIIKKSYDAKPQKLEAPAIVLSSDRFNYEEAATIVVGILNPNDPSISSIQYRINDEPWMTYVGDFSLSVIDYEKGAKIRARAIPGAEYYMKSKVVNDIIKLPLPRFGGETIAFFNDPTGGPGLVTNLASGEENEFFSWGTSYYSGKPPSWMRIEPKDFSNIEPNERFSLAALEYYNGTIYGGTGANQVQLNVELHFDTGHDYNFDFTLEMVNTPNSGVSEEEAADIVQLATLASNASTTIDGNEYYLVLEFGETSANGFSTVDKFHVIENASATGNLYATLILANELDEYDPYYFGDLSDDITPDDGIEIEETLAPLLLALDATAIDYRIPSIKEVAVGHDVDPKWLINKDLASRYKGNPWLRWSELYAGDEVILPGGTFTQHGWFSLPPYIEPDVAEAFALGDIPAPFLSAVPDVTFLEAEGLSMLINRTIVAVVYERHIAKRRRTGKSDLSGKRLGRLAFTVTGIEPSASGRSDALWDIRVRIEPPLESTIYDINPWAPPTYVPTPEQNGSADPLTGGALADTGQPL